MTLARQPSQAPNILVLLSDQQQADAMSCVLGDQWLKTPHLDALAADGARFSRAYCCNPLCRPSRASMLTGLYTHQTGQHSNLQDRFSASPASFTCLGRLFQDHGYDSAYFGKWHFPFEQEPEVHGFRFFDIRHGRPQDSGPEAIDDFLRAPRSRPFLAVASWNYPHSPAAPGPVHGELPPLFANHLPQEHEPDSITRMREVYCGPDNNMGRASLGNHMTFTEQQRREQRWHYYRMIEHLDGMLGRVLTTLRESGQEENTWVVHLSDHGECCGVHNLSGKSFLVDASSRVPLIVTRKGHTRPAVVDTLVNTGIDLIPTLAGLAGIPAPAGLPGCDLRPLVEGCAPDWQRSYVVCENRLTEFSQDELTSPYGRMLRTDRYKYCLYSEGERRESLVDMADDPGETINRAGDPALRGVLAEHRDMLREHARDLGDRRALSMLDAVAS